ncbi:MAG TPA: hypothetical protein ENK46_03325 [Flavobacteriia bacterium]|nr:hypothetical protein [Flavobacteriia bacterium]
MKPTNILFITVLVLFVQTITAQITPIETVTEAKKTTYKANSFDNYNVAFKNQSYELMQKLQRRIKLIDTVDLSFVRVCLNETTNDSIVNNNTVLYIEYIVNQDGDVMSCSLINYGFIVSITNTEIECILENALNNQFNFTNVPTEVNQFYLKIKKRYIP